MALPKQVWETARTIWESVGDITWLELQNQLGELFDDVPSISSLSRRQKKEGWQKITLPKNAKSTPKNAKNFAKCKNQNAKNNKVQNTPILIENAKSKPSLQEQTTQKIQQKMDSLVLDAEQKKQIIIKHRRRITQLGELQDKTVDTLQKLDGTDVEDDENIKFVVMMSGLLSGSLDKLAGVQKLLFEQEMIVSGITVDDFKQSEQDRRMQSLHLLEGIHEEEQQARANKVPDLMARLAEFERLEVQGFDELTIEEESDEDEAMWQDVDE